MFTALLPNDHSATFCRNFSWRCCMLVHHALSAHLRIMYSSDDRARAAAAQTAVAECAAGRKEDWGSERSRRRGVRGRRRWSSAPPLPPSPAAVPSSTWCVCSGTRSSPDSRRGAGPRRCCAAPAPTGSGTSGSCAPGSAAAAGWTQCESVDFLPSTSGAFPDTEPRPPPGCSFHLPEDAAAVWSHLETKLLEQKFKSKSVYAFGYTNVAKSKYLTVRG